MDATLKVYVEAHQPQGMQPLCGHSSSWMHVLEWHTYNKVILHSREKTPMWHLRTMRLGRGLIDTVLGSTMNTIESARAVV